MNMVCALDGITRPLYSVQSVCLGILCLLFLHIISANFAANYKTRQRLQK